jgi:hypothetical protein
MMPPAAARTAAMGQVARIPAARRRPARISDTVNAISSSTMRLLDGDRGCTSGRLVSTSVRRN